MQHVGLMEWDQAMKWSGYEQFVPLVYSWLLLIKKYNFNDKILFNLYFVFESHVCLQVIEDCWFIHIEVGEYELIKLNVSCD